MARKDNYIAEIDQLIGKKIYSLRLAKGVILATQQLAEIIGGTDQQRQKYQQGANRIALGD